MEINILNEKFENVDKFAFNLSMNAEDINEPVVHQVVKALLASRRQGNACTKNKALVRGGGKKPFKQKGTGRARQGSTRSPLMPGGGTIFGPTPRSYEMKVNKRVMKKAIHSILADKFQAGKLTVVESIGTDGKTKSVFKSLNERGLLPGLVVVDGADSLGIRAVRNIKNAKCLPVDGFSVYEAVKFENLIIEKNALEKLISRLV